MTSATPNPRGNAEQRRHPDIFRPEEAAEYLRLDSTRSLDSLRASHGLKGYRVGKGMLYHRKDLDAVADRMLGQDERFAMVNGESRPAMKLYAGRKG